MDIFQEFNKQLKNLTNLRVGDVVFRASMFGVEEITIKTLGFSPLTNEVVINGNEHQTYYASRAEAEEYSRLAQIENLESDIKYTKKRIKELQDEVAGEEQKLAKLKIK